MSFKALPDIKKDFSQWYQDVIFQSELVDHSPVRGSMVIRPYGYSLWEHIRAILDKKIKDTGHKNAAFPLLIPESFLKREAEHVEGFAPELAVVTHAGGKELEEPLVIRPTSETIIHYMFARWISSWRDLPLKINQWANVVRWEMRPRAFLRTIEFFWQEGHTAHETYEQAYDEVKMMLGEYVDLAQNYLAIPVIAGLKSEQEKFPGAEKTFTFEAVMQDGKALQMGTSHLLSQSFAHAFDIVFQDRQGKQAHPYLTSWGTTTRLVGAVVMVHGDQKGLILPPKVAPIQVVIIPILKKNAENMAVLNAAYHIKEQLGDTVRVEIDADAHKTPGSKFYQWELRGVPLRIEIGPRDLASQKACIVNRLTGEKQMVDLDDMASSISQYLEQMHQALFDRAEKQLYASWHHAKKLIDFGPVLEKEHGLFQTGWCQSKECENQLKKYKASTRCLLPDKKTSDICFNCEKPSLGDVLIAKAY